MSDLILQKFYNDIKDPSWPSIETHYEFTKLPANIQDECYQQHNYNNRLQQIEDPDYWVGITAWVWQYKNIVYVPLGKCASTYYRNLFENTLGWERLYLKDVDFEKSHAFGLIRHPLDRHLKGVTEWIYRYKILQSFDGDLENNSTLRNLMSSILIPDTHCMPFSMFYSKHLEKINWIPMDIMSEQQVTDNIEQFLKQHGHNIKLPPNTERLNSSNQQKLNLHKAVKKLFPLKTELEYFYYLFANDLKFYRRLVEKFEHNSTL
jgi:hypothetical protein